MKASIIVPSYNSRERLYYNLIALNGQSYEGQDVEVVVVDNGSTDNTIDMLRQFKLKYPMKTLRVEKNQGIALGRNVGVNHAEGDILIFHDSDMIACKDFIKLHLAMHEQPGIVACGMFWRRVFTYLYRNFNQSQLNNFERVRRTMGLLPLSTYPNGYPVISEHQVSNSDLNPYSFDLDFSFITDLKAIIRQYGNTLDNYFLPWRFFITNNLSVERQRVIDVGMFDANIIKYGYEDYDLGIRLYKSGCKFIIADHIVSLHQEHPANYQTNDLIENINYICNKYNNIYFMDMPLVCLSDGLGLDRNVLNGIMSDVSTIFNLKNYNELLELFLELLQLVRKQHYARNEDNTPEAFKNIASNMGVYVKKANELKAFGITHFLNQLKELFKKTLRIDFEELMRVNA